MSKVLLGGLAVMSLACGPAPEVEEAPAGQVDPAASFRALETRLLAAGVVSVDFHVTAQGAFEAEIQGSLEVSSEGASLVGSGQFGGEPVDLFLTSEGGEYSFGNGENRSSAEEPAALREALVIGLTRMGVLHNLAMLTSGSPPDHADGGVREWVTVDGFGVDPQDASAVSFDLTVSGEPSGSASLLINTDGIPLLRRQTVQFPDGEMQVVERYSGVVIEP